MHQCSACLGWVTGYEAGAGRWKLEHFSLTPPPARPATRRSSLHSEVACLFGGPGETMQCKESNQGLRTLSHSEKTRHRQAGTGGGGG